MPELIHKADLMDKLRYMDNIHRKNIIRAYNDGWNNYIHKKDGIGKEMSITKGITASTTSP